MERGEAAVALGGLRGVNIRDLDVLEELENGVVLVEVVVHCKIIS